MKNVIKNLKEAEMASNTYFLEEDNKQYQIQLFHGAVQIQDYTNNLETYFRFGDNIPFFELLRTATKIKKWDTVEEFLNIVKGFEGFSQYESKPKFNPFYKELTGPLKIKAKDGVLTKAQLKKVLKHRDTEVIYKYYLTDDYRADASENFRKNEKKSRNGFLKEVCEYGNYFITLKDGVIEAYNNWESYRITNKNLIY